MLNMDRQADGWMGAHYMNYSKVVFFVFFLI